MNPTIIDEQQRALVLADTTQELQQAGFCHVHICWTPAPSHLNPLLEQIGDTLDAESKVIFDLHPYPYKEPEPPYMRVETDKGTFGVFVPEGCSISFLDLTGVDIQPSDLEDVANTTFFPIVLMDDQSTLRLFRQLDRLSQSTPEPLHS